MTDTPLIEIKDLRGNRLAMIFQEPMTSLNPSFTIGDQITESILRHRGGSRSAARKRAIELLRRVRIPSPERRIDEYPHKLSGGMRQRVMIATALACDPRLLIADEPTTALDVTLQAQILDLMRELKAESGAAIILITHDLGVVAEVCDEVALMYAGEVVERRFGYAGFHSADPRPDHQRQGRGLCRSRAIVPGPRPTTARPLLGQHAQFGAALSHQRAVDGGMAGAGDFPGGAVVQSDRRRPARCARPAAAAVAVKN
jgi:ABC-type microcin C transport system duplicated ATPase subunit YejF